MKIYEAIERIDAIKHNTYTDNDKITWLSNLDGLIKKNIIDTHRGAEIVEFSGYTSDTPKDTELLVTAPYDEIYLHWLEAKIDFSNGEYSKYNNAIITYNTYYSDYANYYNRTHEPLSAGPFKF